MKNKNKLDLAVFAKYMGTRVHKTDSNIGEFIKYKTKTIKGIVYDDGSGGMELKVPGIDFFINDGTIQTQIKDLESRIAAYEALKTDLKKLKVALNKSQPKIPEKVKPHVKFKSK